MFRFRLKNLRFDEPKANHTAFGELSRAVEPPKQLQPDYVSSGRVKPQELSFMEKIKPGKERDIILDSIADGVFTVDHQVADYVF
jgi:hypothetical protein